jgi:hypothetical protein
VVAPAGEGAGERSVEPTGRYERRQTSEPPWYMEGSLRQEPPTWQVSPKKGPELMSVVLKPTT